MAWKCVLCMFFTLTLRMLMRHIHQEHASDPAFSIRCNLGDCPQTYTKFNSYYRHVLRNHSSLMTQTEPDTPKRNDSAVVDDTGETVQQLYVQETQGEEEDNAEEEMETEGESIEEHGETSECDQDDFDTDTNKRPAVSYIMNLKDMHKIRETTAEAVAIGTNAMVQRYMDILQRKVYRTLRAAAIDPATIPSLKEQFEVELPFDSITSVYERNKYIKENYFYVEPESIILGSRLEDIHRQGTRQLEILDDTYMYFPMNKSIEQFLQNREIFQLVMEDPITLPTGFYSNISSGDIFRNHPIFQCNREALQIILYFDDLEICNPMSKRAGTHKIGLFYYTLGNLPPTYRSKLAAIRLLAIIKRKFINKYTMDSVLKRIKYDLDLLSQGISVTVFGQHYQVYGSCICFVGDTLAAHEFGGFKMGVGFSFQKCRECECTFEDMQNKYYDRDFIQRSLQRYDDQCSDISEATTQMMKDLLATSYGIVRRSEARDFPHFNLTKMIPEDIMHVIFEGVAVYEVKSVLKHMIEKKSFTLTQLNNLIETFQYGYRDRSNRPVPIPVRVFNSQENALRQSASSMIVFLRLLPFFLIEKLNCDPNDAYMCFLNELCTITLIALSSVISTETINLLRFIIGDHMKKFKELFPGKNIFPKQHYLQHLPSTIERFGSLTNVWSMRFEGKHQFIKQRMYGCQNYRNIVKSIADRCAVYECTLNTCLKHPLLKDDLTFGKLTKLTNIESCKQSIFNYFGTEVDAINNLYEASWILYNGNKFIKDQCEVAFGEQDGLPEFGRVVSIWVSVVDGAEVEQIEAQTVYFQLKMYETIQFDDNIQAYEVAELEIAQGLELVYVESLFIPAPLHVYEGRNSRMFIPIPYDMTDVVRLKQNERCSL